MDAINDILVASAIGGDKAKIVCIWQCDERYGFVSIVKLVTKLFLHVLQLEEHRVKHHKEDSGAEGVTLKHATFEGEGLRSPVRSLNHSLAATVKIGKIFANIVREMVSLESLHYKAVGDAPEGVLQVKKGNMTCPLGSFCVLD